MTTPTDTQVANKSATSSPHASPIVDENMSEQEAVQAIADRIEATFGGITRHKASLLYDLSLIHI